MAEENKTKKGVGMNKLSLLLLLVSLVGNALLGSLFLQTRKELDELKANPQIAGQEEVQAIVDEVSKLIALPDGVTPTLATVNNAENLRERQPFFQSAENGDKVLLYSNATDPTQRKAYLYRPSSKQLLNVAPITIGGNQLQAQEDEFSVVVRNATGREGLEDQMEQLLGQVFPNATVTEKGAATNKDYEKIYLVQVNASDELAQKVGDLFGIEVVDLPEGEADPGDVDMMILLGGAETVKGEDQAGETGKTEVVGENEGEVQGETTEGDQAETEVGGEATE